MRRYAFPDGARAVLESLQQPFAVCQFTDKRAIALLVSDMLSRALPANTGRRNPTRPCV